MSKARDLGNLLDTGGDVVSGSLDNVPTPSKTSIEGLSIELPAANLTGTVATGRLPATVEITTVDWGAWTAVESGGVLYFKYNGISKMKIDSSGNLTVVGNITAYGSV